MKLILIFSATDAEGHLLVAGLQRDKSHAVLADAISAQPKHVRTSPRWSSGTREGLKLDKEFIHTITAKRESADWPVGAG